MAPMALQLFIGRGVGRSLCPARLNMACMKTIDFTPFHLFLSALKTLHWTADTHTEHVVLGDAYDEFEKKVDEFVENYLGCFEKVQFTVERMVPEAPQGRQGLEGFEALFKEFMESVDEYAEEGDGALKSLRDDLQAIGNRTAYLLRMK